MPIDKNEILAEIGDIIRNTVGDFEFDEDLDITPESTFEGLGMESLDIVAFAGRVQARYGEAVNFAEFVSRMGARDVNELRIGRVVDYIVDSLNGPAGVTAP